MIEAIVRDVNCLGVFATSRAKDFCLRFPDNQKYFKNEFDHGRVEPGRILVFDRGQGQAPRYIINFPTRIHWKGEVNWQTLQQGISDIFETSIGYRIERFKIEKFEPSDIASWEETKLEFLTSFARMPDIELEFIEAAGERKQVTIFTDGGAEPNPGVGGYGVVLRFGDKEKELSGAFEKTNNNRMELLAATVGLESLKEPCDVRLHSDSRYVVDTVAKGNLFRWHANRWKKVKNRDLWERFLRVYIKHKVQMIWVKGHAGVTDNERGDQLATAPIASKDRQRDEAYVGPTKGKPKPKKKAKTKATVGSKPRISSSE